VTATVDERAGLESPARSGAFRSGSSRLTNLLLPFLGTAIAIGAWWAATIIFDINPFFLPSPPDVVESFMANPTYMMKEFWVTLYEVLTGYAIALVAGLTVATLLAALKPVERALMPLFVSLNSIPKVALAPLLMVWLGFGAKPKIIMVVLICFFPIVVATMAGLSATPAELTELGRSMSATWWKMFVKVRVRWALPQVFVGLKVAISLAVIGAIVAEIANPGKGLGSVIVISGQTLDTAAAFTCIVLLALMSVMLYYTVATLERLLLPWAREITG
jgi:NitT/TauT family transport system permease protein